MTFIASVIAKKGVVIIADSLVTSSRHILEFEDYHNYIKTKSAESSDDKFTFDPGELIQHFKLKPSHTKDYQNKLFQFGKYSAITVAGAATLNGKTMEEIIDLCKVNLPTKLEDKVEKVKNVAYEHAKSWVEEKGSISTTVFMLTHYDRIVKKTKIYKIVVNQAVKDELAEANFELVSVYEEPERFKVVCDGQNRISERILFGDVDTLLNLIPTIANKIFDDFKIKAEDVPVDYIQNLYRDKSIVTSTFYEDIKINKLTELSLQQAYDLASLLMKIEMNMQKYTENIPTVGGVVKIAVIDDKGFKFIHGNEIHPEEKFH